ncbi:sugar phosphate isomerase/epimerase [Aneurinibacillus sp. Ricciae_BoGa-3]|uniref:sugar phosphate isomerase/epimerase family protein n=1 Tax=Aneurinibacillus sp. Ricciae_BoGa-3 TaxID=3022697 RepID=UPI00234217C2|nr:sugar phosphate isomerase/epimerase family protein [Aneurinibacillus sp. Ricciae_BoGa-3]WCK53192.1 sugar phosphate isomerase/epimerase [Aneurinibacillus sp. Ricciae_BoGa-3]
MKFGYQTNTWGGVVGHPAGVTSIKDLFYLTNGSNDEAVNDIASAGYQGIEIFDGNLYQYAGETTKFKELLEEKKLSLIGVYSGANFIYKDVLEDELWRIEEAAKLGKEFGAEHFVVGGGAVRSKGILPEDYRALAHGLDKVVEITNHYGLKASFHPHLGTIAQSPEQVDRIFEYTSIDFCPDTAHLAAGGADLLAIVSKYIDRVKYIHFKDYANGEFLPLGKGQLPLDKLAQLLLEHKYDGWVTVELDYYEGHPKDGALISKKYLDSVFK